MRSQVYRERTTIRLALLTIVVAAIGLLLLVISSAWEPVASSPELQTVIRDLGSLLLVTLAVALLWELFARRAFVAELLATTDLAEDIETTGLLGASAKWHGEIDWQRMFASSDTFELLFAYGRTWRNTYRAYLTEFATRNGTSAKIALPDPDDAALVAELARRFEKTPEELAENVREAERDFIEIFRMSDEAERKLEIWRISAAPVWSYYRFNGIAIFTLYKHRPGRKEVPTFIVRKGGTLYEFLRAEFDALVTTEGELSRRSFPPQAS